MLLWLWTCTVDVGGDCGRGGSVVAMVAIGGFVLLILGIVGLLDVE